MVPSPEVGNIIKMNYIVSLPDGTDNIYDIYFQQTRESRLGTHRITAGLGRGGRYDESRRKGETRTPS